MSILHLLEDFSRLTFNFSQYAAEDEELEAEKLTAFENGYKAGWDDAVKAQTADMAHLSEELTQNLKDLSFTYHEAKTALTGAVEPFMTDVVQVLLPHLVRETLGMQIAEQLHEIVQDHSEAPVEVVVAPNSVRLVKTAITDMPGFPFKIIADNNVGENEAFIRFGATEKQIDMNEILEGVSRAMSGFFHENQKELRHG